MRLHTRLPILVILTFASLTQDKLDIMLKQYMELM